MMVTLGSVIVILRLMLSFYFTLLFKSLLIKKSKLWCVFVDYQRAFDSINRDALWIKLVKSGISCKMTNMIKLIYNDVQSCVRSLSSSGIDNSEFFNVKVGVKQGKPLSPLLFIMLPEKFRGSI